MSSQDKDHTVEECMHIGLLSWQEGDKETAFSWLEKAAEQGSSDAMRFIANMYFHENFRPVRVSGVEKAMADALQRGQLVVMPHQCVDSEEPDYRTAWEWYMKAAEHGDIDSMSNAGVMALQGIGCEKNVELAEELIGKAAEAGNPFAQKAYRDFFGKTIFAFKPDDQYTALLADFQRSADVGDETASFEIYRNIILGTDRQLARLGYILAKGKYNSHEIYRQFGYPVRNTGEPYAPAYLFTRFEWVSYLKIDLNAFDEEEILLSFTSDVGRAITPVKWVEVVGEIEYTSGSFGWLRERKTATVFRVDRNLPIEAARIESCPISNDYLLEEDSAWFIEDGEKEYSAEICQIKDGQPIILCRYTIDGADQGERVSKAIR